MFLVFQNGASTVETEFVDPNEPLFIRNGRDLANIAFSDLLYSEAFRTALILFQQGVLGGSVGPYEQSERQQGFATFGAPHILTAMASASSSTRHAWYAKVRQHSSPIAYRYGRNYKGHSKQMLTIQYVLYTSPKVVHSIFVRSDGMLTRVMDRKLHIPIRPPDGDPVQ